MKRLKVFMYLCCVLLLCPVGVHATEQTIVEGDGYEVVEDFDTSKSESTSCSLTVQAVCPDGFGLNCYALLEDEQGGTYRISMSADNGYLGQIYLAPGCYQILEVTVFDDYKQEYPFIVTQSEIVLQKNESNSIIFTLQDYEKIQNEIAERIGDSNSNTGEMVFSDTQIFETGVNGISMQGTSILYYDVEHVGTGKGIMEITGNATGNYEIVVKIVKSGVLGEAVFQISLDGGNSYIGQDVVSESSLIGDAGLTLYFQTEADTDEFWEGDEYRAKVPENFPVISSKVSSANLVVTGHPMEEHDFTVSILSSGGLGSSRFTVTSTKGEEMQITDTIPADGRYEIADNMILIFSKSDAYERGLTYSVTVKSNDDTVNYTPFYILVGVLITEAAVVLSVMSSKKETDRDYQIHPYRWKKENGEY